MCLLLHVSGRVWHTLAGRNKPLKNRRHLRSWCEMSPSRLQSRNLRSFSGASRLGILQNNICHIYFLVFFVFLPKMNCHNIQKSIISQTNNLENLLTRTYISLSLLQYVWRVEDRPPAKERSRWSSPWLCFRGLPHEAGRQGECICFRPSPSCCYSDVLSLHIY